MNTDFFPEKINSALRKINLDNVYEIRLRVGFPIFCITNVGKKTINTNGQDVICSNDDIAYIIEKITKRSIYAFNNQIKKGFLDANDGIRVGLGGECVFEDDRILTIRNVSSLNVRIPHKIKGCGDYVFNKIYIDNKIENTLIISPAGYGKTTLLKDLIRNINDKTNFQILVIDERGEFCNINGINIDKITYSDKLYAFNFGIRSLSPSLIVTDELSSENDWICAFKAVNSGCNVIASCHAKGINELINKKSFNNSVFSRYVVLGNNKKGEIEGVYNQNFIRIWNFLLVFYSLFYPR